MGSPAVATFIAHVAFWTLVVYGVVGELKAKRVTAFLLVWLGGRFGLPYVPYGAAMFSSFVAVLDIALVLLPWQYNHRHRGDNVRHSSSRQRTGTTSLARSARKPLFQKSTELFRRKRTAQFGPFR